MARELNRELFGNTRESAQRDVTPATPATAYARADEVRVLHLHIESLTKRMKDYESRVEVLSTKVEDLVAQNKQRFERVQSHFLRQNEQVQHGFGDVNQKMAHIVSRVNERKVNDNVIKEMVDRQAHLVQTFEVRMNQLTKVINEQEMQLMNARSELKDAIQEISRLKKL